MGDSVEMFKRGMLEHVEHHAYVEGGLSVREKKIIQLCAQSAAADLMAIMVNLKSRG